MILSACQTTPPKPVGPISTGDPRTDPVATEDPDGDVGLDDAADEEMGFEDSEDDELKAGAYIPPHMADRDVVLAGVLLPFTHPSANVRKEAEGMLAAIEMALFDHASENIVILPHDTAGATGTTRAQAEALKDGKADMVLGPLIGANVGAAREVMTGSGVFGFDFEKSSTPVIGFSLDTSVAGEGAWLASILPENEVGQLVEFAAIQGYDSFAFFGPQSSFGARVETAMQQAVFQSGGSVLTSVFYTPGAATPSAEAQSFASMVELAVARGDRVAVIIPDRGNQLRRIAPLLAYHGVDTRRVKMLGLANWNDPAVWREPTLDGAWFVSTPLDEGQAFATRFQRQYGRAPTSLASVAYDAAALTFALIEDGELDPSELTNADGFLGTNGLFRFLSDGTTQRELSVLQIDQKTEGGVREIKPAGKSFRPGIG